MPALSHGRRPEIKPDQKDISYSFSLCSAAGMTQPNDSPAARTGTATAASLEADLNPPAEAAGLPVATPPGPTSSDSLPSPPPPTAQTDESCEDGAPPSEGYDPADYRWVPVRRRPRLDGWTEEKLRRFIEVLADTGLVSTAAQAVGMSRESAYRLRRSAHGGAFARAWDAARHHAGALVEDIAFERAFEGVEHNVYDEYGEVVCTKRVYNDRLLMFLLGHLKPERYGAQPARTPTRTPAAPDAPSPPPPIELEASLRAMEPTPPEPPERLLDPDTLAAELEIADIADGKLPHFLTEQRPPKSEGRLAAEKRAADEALGAAACDKPAQELSREEFAAMCRYLDPIGAAEPSRKRYR